MTDALLDLALIYSEARSRAPWDGQTEVPEGPALVKQYDEVIGAAVEDLGRALEAGDLEGARAVQRGLLAVSDAFGGAEWIVQR